jgi:HAD superfamily phosphoserine phosphatase-like hydrolase
MALAFVDLDGTLLRGPSCERAFIAHLLRRGALGPRQLLAAAAFALRWSAPFGRHVLKKNKAWLAGLEAAEIARHAASFDMTARQRPQMFAELQRMRAAGHRLVLLTGAPQFLAAPLARTIGCDDCCATLCARAGSTYLAAPPLRHPFGHEKLLIAEALAAERGCALADCVAYADSIHDLPLLAAVGEPVAVHPDRALRRVAHERGWRIVDDAATSRAPGRAADARA